MEGGGGRREEEGGRTGEREWNRHRTAIRVAAMHCAIVSKHDTFSVILQSDIGVVATCDSH